MQTRRQFVRTVAGLAGAAELLGAAVAPIQQALAIEPAKGSTFLDAEHVVILMQENRSFDHAFGTLQGVRGFNDPRAIRLADGNPVWVQSNAAGEKFIPFRLDIKESNATWIGSLPHGWPDQVDAANGGKHDRWLEVKRSGKKNVASIPLTLGYHTRDDIPFYYALADAFTICDQNFCSSLTGTTPNRLYLWTGTIRQKPTPESPALVRNEDCDYGQWVSWKTFPERLEEAGVSWKIYQNELTVRSGLSDEADAWLANFGDNPIEWFTQFQVRLAPRHREFLKEQIKALPAEIESLTNKLAGQSGEAADKLRNRIARLKATLALYERDYQEFTPEAFDKLTARQKSLHAQAFSTNAGDPAFRELADFSYKVGSSSRHIKLPRGDILYQFRKDVGDGKLPAVSWIVPPEHFSDHPSSAWYGQWYLSEVLSILTKNPDVWKKTIFILTYDENDGFFDHVPPFQAPHPKKADTGLVSKGIDTSVDYLELEADRKHKPHAAVRGNSLGLGFRVPMIIASPWTRGGCVCSQVFDHTSVLQFLEKLWSHKTGRKIEETNISAWRRTVCGDLSAAFQASGDGNPGLAQFVARDPFVETIHKALYKELPAGFHPLSAKEVEQIRSAPRESLLPAQEPGVRRSSPLPYELEVDGALNKERTRLVIRFEGGRQLFGQRAAGAPFIAYAFTAAGLSVRHYAVAAGERLEDSWPLEAFDKGRYSVRVHGPNGFFREFRGAGAEVNVDVGLAYAHVKAGQPELTGSVQVVAVNGDGRGHEIVIRDNAYGHKEIKQMLPVSRTTTFTIDTPQSHGWYDISVTLPASQGFERRYAGRVETGSWSFSDPFMGRMK